MQCGNGCADGRRLYVGVGSLTNIAEGGMEVEEGRACIYEIDLETDACRVFAGGLRNPVGKLGFIDLSKGIKAERVQ
mgnify:CR=1 FL=1